MANELENQLNVIARYLEQDMRVRLLQSGHKATGELITSIQNTVERGSSSLSIDGTMAKQGVFVISGRRPGLKGIPIDALEKWVKNKGFSDGIKGTRGIAFAIQSSIIEKGIKPDDFISDVFDMNSNRIENDISLATEQALDASLTNLINQAKQFA